MIDLDSYLDRIGHISNGATLPPTLATLQLLQALHTHAIAYENLSSLLGDEVHLDDVSLTKKLLKGGRGGYCFEHNLLFQQVLRQLGFKVPGLAARVRWNVPDEVDTPHTHMLLLVSLEEGAYIADVGFGGMTLTSPLQLKADIEQPTSHEPFRLRFEAGSYTLQARLGAEWRPVYCFDLQEQFMADYAMLNWYVSHFPESRFVNNLLAARPKPGCRHALFNRRYTIHFLDGRSETKLLGDPDEIKRVLREIFGIRLPETPQLETYLRQLVDQQSDRLY